jgi:mRNA-degrading endonuclease RelE of RelBE toxin-antitoxin system
VIFLDIIVSSMFRRQIKHLDGQTKVKFKKQIIKILAKPTIGKPLKYGLRGERSLRLPPFRIVYSYNSNKAELVFLKFDHRSTVYGE